MDKHAKIHIAGHRIPPYAPHLSSPLCKRGARGDLATVNSTMADLKPQHLPPQQRPEIAP